MADVFQLNLIRDRGVNGWNSWRGKERQRAADASEPETRIDLRGAELEGANLGSIDLAGADLRSANLNSTHLRGANLRGANLTGADLGYANLQGADLSAAILRKARLGGAILTAADLTGADLKDAYIQGPELNDDFTSREHEPTDFRWSRLERADLRGAYLDEVDMRGAALEGTNLEAAEIRNLDRDEFRIGSIQFTVFQPGDFGPGHWHTLLAYCHTTDTLRDVYRDCEGRLRSESTAYRELHETARTAVPRGAEVIVVPELEGCEVNPTQASFRWLEDWHCTEFRARPTHDADPYEFLSGRLSFLVEGVILGEVPLSIYVNSGARDEERPHESKTNLSHEKVFVSYSHTDTSVVERIQRFVDDLGKVLPTHTTVEFLVDADILRSGERWSPKLLRYIEDADVFQLCWSAAASASKNVEKEWRHALDLDREAFIRPIYWRRPMPEPPVELQPYHFAFIELDDSNTGCTLPTE
jgi:hypothetical protein